MLEIIQTLLQSKDHFAYLQNDQILTHKFKYQRPQDVSVEQLRLYFQNKKELIE